MRGVYTNFAKKFMEVEYRDHFLAYAKATTMVDFNANMEKLKEFNDKAWEHLIKFNPKV